jgi:hypothetical protein
MDPWSEFQDWLEPLLPDAFNIKQKDIKHTYKGHEAHPIDSGLGIYKYVPCICVLCGGRVFQTYFMWP